MVKGDYGTQQSVDQQQAKVDSSRRRSMADQAAIESAQTQLTYATITAPIDGRVGFRQVDAGNIIHASRSDPAHGADPDQAGHRRSSRCRRTISAPVREAMLQGHRRGRSPSTRTTSTQLAHGHAAADRQPDRSGDRTIRLKARFRQQGRAAVAGRVRAHARLRSIRARTRDHSAGRACSAARTGSIPG